MKRPKPEMIPIEEGDAWERQLLLSCIPLKRLSPEMDVEGYASGCFVEYRGFRLILSVSHATLKPGMWALELKYEDGKGMKMFQLSSQNFLGRVPTNNLVDILREGRISELSKDMVDFSYGIVPDDLESIHEQFSEDGRLHWSAPRTVFKADFEQLPVKGLRYGFSGHTQIDKLPHPTVPHLSVLCSTQTVCGDLTYLRTEGDVHYFQLPGEHPGHVHFEGCSGAPIISERGEVVALVTGGDTSEATIRGVSLKTYKTAIDIEVGNIAGLKRGLSTSPAHSP